MVSFSVGTSPSPGTLSAPTSSEGLTEAEVDLPAVPEFEPALAPLAGASPEELLPEPVSVAQPANRAAVATERMAARAVVKRDEWKGRAGFASPDGNLSIASL